MKMIEFDMIEQDCDGDTHSMYKVYMTDSENEDDATAEIARDMSYEAAKSMVKQLRKKGL
jgi:hypothetical protein